MGSRTYNQPHGFHQPAEGVSWYVAANENKNSLAFSNY